MKRILLGLFVVAACHAVSADDLPALHLDGMAVQTRKQTFVLDADGLPRQIVIKAAPSELPLELRGGGNPPEALLQTIGRGGQLRAPMRIVARVLGKEVVAVPVKPARVQMEDGIAVAIATLKAGVVPVELKAGYGPSGRMDFSVTYGGVAGGVEALSLVIDLAGPVDTVVPGNPAGDSAKAYNPALFGIVTREGVVWSNFTGNLPGIAPRVFVGSGDRGFTWLAANAQGFDVEPAFPTMLLERNKAGEVTWRCHLVNYTTRLEKRQTASFSILTHPLQTKPPDARAMSWLSPPEKTIRADELLDQAGRFVLLDGAAGGDAISATQNIAHTYPLNLHRYFAATHTGLPARLRTNAAKLINAGMFPAADRMALGRALLFDIGVDARGLANLTEAASVVKALDKFGLFKNDDKTEFIPYWRSGAIIRYGETFSSRDAFELSREDPAAGVRVGIWRRRAEGGGVSAFIAVVNESDKPVRQQLYVLDAARLFGSQNQIREAEVIGGWDMSAIPADSDWRKSRLQSLNSGSAGSPVCMVDAMDGGFVERSAAAGNTEVYGPLYIEPYSFRLVYGTGK